MIKHTFVHIPGIGYKIENQLWKSGILTWDDFLNARSVSHFSSKRISEIWEMLAMSKDALARRDISFFKEYVPIKELWRLYEEFADETAFLDIETTGEYGVRESITMIGLFDGNKTNTYIKGINLEEFLDEIARHKIVVTFNGSIFDLPVIENEFNGFEFNHCHVDLRFLLKRLQLYGGLKAIENKVGIVRDADIRGFGGYDAIRLWNDYEQGNKKSLELLKRYNEADVVNLKTLLDWSYNHLKETLLNGMVNVKS